MPIFDITPDDVQVFTIITNPPRTFSSSSLGVTGSVHIIARRSVSEKELTAAASSYSDTPHDDANASSALKAAQEAGFVARTLGEDFARHVSAYLSGVNTAPNVARNTATLDVRRIVPGTSLDTSVMQKLVIKDLVEPYYRPSRQSAHWAYTNYHCFNFFTASSVSENTALFYPNVDGGQRHAGHITGVYALSGGFSIDFSVNPCYRPPVSSAAFQAGTILHLSSAYALSIVSGSARDHNNMITGYRLLLQLSSSADISPATASPAAGQFVFMSDDNSLSFNTWHRVIVRWGTQYTNDGTGSFNVDGVDRGTFVIPSASIMGPSSLPGPGFLAVGCHVVGTNDPLTPWSSFFAPSLAYQQGVRALWAVDGAPVNIAVTSQLNAELHDLTIRRRYVSNAELVSSASRAPGVIDDSYAFYVGPFFRQSSTLRRVSAGMGGFPITPYDLCDGTTEDPANALMALSVGGHLINVENYVHDLANDLAPALVGLAYDAVAVDDSTLPANDVLYSNQSACRRNTFILPCDDGAWIPNFDLIGSCLTGSRHVTEPGHFDASSVYIGDLVSNDTALFGPVLASAERSQEAMMQQVLGVVPEEPGGGLGPRLHDVLTNIERAINDGTYTPAMHRNVPTSIYQRTRDASSSAVTIFDVSSIFYGSRILPGSVVITDPAITGSDGRMTITLRDDGFGGLYRANALSQWSTWNSVGTVHYDEGLLIVKSPHLALFGKDGFSVSFKGERPIHVLRLDAMAPANQLNSSSNPAYVALRPSSNQNDPDTGFVYITAINFHDENLNVIARTQLAQPIKKRHGDRIAFKVKLDF